MSLFARRPRRAVLQQSGKPQGIVGRAKTLGAYEGGSGYEVVVESELKRLKREVEEGAEERDRLKRELDEALATVEAVCEEVENIREECGRKEESVVRLRERVAELERGEEDDKENWKGENWGDELKGLQVMRKIENGWWELEMEELERELNRERWLRGVAEGEVRRLEGVLERWERRWERERGGLKERERLVWARMMGALKVWEGERGGRGVFVGKG